MKRLFSLTLLALALCQATFAEEAPKRSKRVVMISLDGVSVAGFQTAKTPNLDALMAEGALSTTTRIVMPSVTLPNWTSMLTGSGPEQHGTVDNGWQIDKFILPPVAKDADGYYPSVFSILKENVPTIKTAFYYNWPNLIYPYNKKNLDEISYLDNDGYIENYDKAFNFIVKHKQDPTLVFLYSGHTDNAGHKHKWEAPGYIKSIEEADVQIGIFLQKMKDAGLYEGTTFLFLSDHGGIEYGHGGVTVNEMIVPWGITGPSIKKGYQITEPNNTVNTGSVILRLFKVKQPAAWTGQIVDGMFK